MNKVVNIGIALGLIIIIALASVIIFDPFGIRKEEKPTNLNTIQYPDISYDESGLTQKETKSLTQYDKLMLEAYEHIENSNYYQALNLLAEADAYTDKEKIKEKIENLYNSTLVEMAKRDERKGINRDYSLLLLRNRRAIREGDVYDDIDRLIHSAMFRAEAVKQYAEALDLLFIADKMLPNPRQQILISNMYKSITDKLRQKDKQMGIIREYQSLEERRKNAEVYKDSELYLMEEELLPGLDPDSRISLDYDEKEQQENEDVDEMAEKDESTEEKVDSETKTKKETIIAKLDKTNSKPEATTKETFREAKEVPKTTSKTSGKVKEVSKRPPRTEKTDEHKLIKHEEEINEDEMKETQKIIVKTDETTPIDFEKLYKDKSYDEMINYLVNELEKDLDNIDLMIKLTEAYFLNGDIDKSLETSEDIVKLNFSDPNNIKRIADNFYKNDMEKVAFHMYSTYITRWDNDYEALYKLALMEIERRNYENANGHLIHIIKHKANLNRELMRDSYYALGIISELEGDRAKAVGYYSETLKWGEDFIKAMLQLGKLYYKLGKEKKGTNQFGKAKDILTQALNLDPENFEALIYLGKTQERLGKTNEAMKQYRKAIKADSSNVYIAKMLLANALTNVGKANEALTIYDSILNTDSSDIEGDYRFYLKYAETLRMSGRIEESKEAYQKALELGADEHIVSWGLSKVFFDEHNYDKSLEYARQTLSLDGVKMEYLLSIATSYNVIGELDSAVEYYKRCISLEPDNAFSYEELAKVYLSMKEYDKAIQLLEGFIRNLNVEATAETYQILGEGYMKSGNKIKSTVIFSKLIEKYPDYQNISVINEYLHNK